MLMYLAETQAHVVMLMAPERPREPGQLPGESGGLGLPGLPGFRRPASAEFLFPSGLRAQGQPS